MVTLKDISEKSNISLKTVSRILNSKNKENRPSAIARGNEIRRLALEMGYRPNAAARAVRKQSTRHIGIFIEGSYSAPYEFPVIVGINECLQSRGYSLSVISTFDMNARDFSNSHVLREHFLESIFILHIPDPIRELVEKLDSRCIYVDCNIRKKYNCVFRDEYYSGHLAAKKMIQSGFRKLLILENEKKKGGHCYAVERPQGIIDAANESGVEVQRLAFSFASSQGFTEREDLLLPYLNPSFGIIAIGQELAEYCSHCAGKHGLFPGRDFGLASCAETLSCASVWPCLSRVRFDRINLGRQAGNMMLQLLGQGETQLPSIKIRNEWFQGETLNSTIGD